MIQDKSIAIIGGGPGGLTLATLLQRNQLFQSLVFQQSTPLNFNFGKVEPNIKVYERDISKHVRIQGGALDLHDESGLLALNKAGLMEAFKRNFRPGAELLRVVDNQANVFLDEHIEGNHADFGDKHYRPEIDRGPLRDILLNSLQPGTVVWNSHILSVEAADNKWKIIFENGNTAVADIVIGADGANSKIRPFVTDIKPFWTGITMIEGSIKAAEKTAPHIHQLLKGGKIFAFGNEQTLIVSSKGDGSFGFSVSWKTEEHWDKKSGINFNDNAQLLAWFKKEFSAWGPVWHELFASETTIFIPRPQYCMPLDQQWEARPNITLIGDAAHWMPPFSGEGVNMAMLDALQLSAALTNPVLADTQDAIAVYEKQMFSRFKEVGQGTLFNTKWMHEANALNDMLAMFGDAN